MKIYCSLESSGGLVKSDCLSIGLCESPKISISIKLTDDPNIMNLRSMCSKPLENWPSVDGDALFSVFPRNRVNRIEQIARLINNRQIDGRLIDDP